MWNCIVTTRRSSSQKKKGQPAKKAEPNGQTLRSMSSSETSTIKPSDHILDGKYLDSREKRTSNGDNNGFKSGGACLRIRVVMTQSQLSQILKESRNSSSLSSSSAAAVKQLLLTSVIKMSSSTENSLSRTTRDDQGGNTNGKWRPRLKSIPED